MYKLVSPILLIITLASILLWTSPTQASDPATCPDTVYLGNYPENADLGWVDDLQGVAHDQSSGTGVPLRPLTLTPERFVSFLSWLVGCL